MRNNLTIVLLFALMVLVGCASNKPFTAGQQAIIKQHKIVVRKKTSEPLVIFNKSNRAGTEVAGVVLGVLTGSYGMASDGNTPRTRLNDYSAGQLIKSTARKAAAEKIETVVTPTLYMQEMLAKKFNYINTENKDFSDKLVIDIKPVAWQLYYDQFFNGENTFVLEYAGDIEMQLASADIGREFPCDKTSEKALSKKEWLANDQLRIRRFSNKLATSCVNKILVELGEKIDDIENVTK